MKNLDWDAFKTGKIVVNCRTEDAARDFLREAEKRNIFWRNGYNATQLVDFFRFGSLTAYSVLPKGMVMFKSDNPLVQVLEAVEWKPKAEPKAEAEAEKIFEAKHDIGKPRLSLVPHQILFDISEVREYGIRKYGDPENWKQVDRQRYVDAMYRHWVEFLKDPASVDSESGIAHYKHVACNMAFICEMMKEEEKH